MAFWVASNNERAGATTDTLVDARCLYLPVAAKNTVYGVCGILMNDADSNDDFGAFEKNLLLMIVGEMRTGGRADRVGRRAPPPWR